MEQRTNLLIFLSFICSLLFTGVCHTEPVLVNDTSIRFVALGDWGGLPGYPYVTPVEKHVAVGMGVLAEKKGVQFILALGDNFYYDGVTSVEDKRFKETYESVFTASSLYVPWYVLAGNHDHRGNVSAQIAYSAVSRRWKFPDFYYQMTFKVKNTLLEILMLDTVLLCGNTGADSKGDQPRGPVNGAVAERQWRWLEDKLNHSRADYLLVAGHFPVWSASWHGPTHCLVERLMPLLYKYKVSAYLCGHDHDLQHLRYTQENHTVDYILSGAGQLLDPFLFHEHAVPPGSLKFHWTNIFGKGGVSYLEATPERLVFSYWDSSGNQLYENSLKPRY